MSQKSQIIPPPVMWAQRTNIVYVTICLEDCKDPQIDIEAEKIYFKGIGGTDKKMHELTINLYAPIVPEKSRCTPKVRVYELVLQKASEGPYWPRLTKENEKFHWLKSDFNKWREEDDSEEEEGGYDNRDMEAMMRQMGGLRPPDSKPNFDDLDNDGNDGEADSDDEEMPDLE